MYEEPLSVCERMNLEYYAKCKILGKMLIWIDRNQEHSEKYLKEIAVLKKKCVDK